MRTSAREVLSTDHVVKWLCPADFTPPPWKMFIEGSVVWVKKFNKLVKNCRRTASTGTQRKERIQVQSCQHESRLTRAIREEPQRNSFTSKKYEQFPKPFRLPAYSSGA